VNSSPYRLQSAAQANRALFAIRRIVDPIIGWIGEHPLGIIALPSLWLLARYYPFWKDVDAFAQLLEPAGATNILHFPPLYCFLSRVPFWIFGTLEHGAVSSIWDRQEPSLLSLRVLIILQHLGLWASLRYFLFSLAPSCPVEGLASSSSAAGLCCSNYRRGLAAILLSSAASLYAFAHTAGSEAWTAITWIAVFSVGLRALFQRASRNDWIVYAAALLLAIGSRKVNGLLLLWLPSVGASPWLLRHYWPLGRSCSLRSRWLRTATLALTIGLSIAGLERTIVFMLCRHFSVIERPTDGATFSDRFVLVIAQLSPVENARFRQKVLALTDDANVRLAIEAQFKFGSYHLGGDQAIARALLAQGWRGEELEAEKDRIIARAVFCFYRAMPPRLLSIIAKEFVRSWAPTSDYRVARSGPFATDLFARSIQETPADWRQLPPLPIFRLSTAQAMLDKVDSDLLINHWQGVPIAVWCLLFIVAGIWRLFRQRLGLDLFLAALSFIAVGTLADWASCLFAYSQPRYTLPLLIAVLIAGCVFLFARTNEEPRPVEGVTREDQSVAEPQPK
jgi:hypothetical protein